MNGRFARVWVAGFIGLLAVFGFGQLESWPFTSWYMFSGVEPEVARVARAVVVSPSGGERALGPEELPAGLLSHRLLQRFADAPAAERDRVCEELLAVARAGGPAREVRVEERRWRILDRAGDRPASVETSTIEVCR